MNSVGNNIEIRSMKIEDTNAMLAIDKEIRAAGKVITYANLTTEYILSAGGKISHRENPISYADSITGNVAGLLDFSFVATADEQIKGFILGQVARLRQATTELGVIQMIGVHPDYQRKGIGTKLVNALADKCRSRGIKTMRLGIDHRDKNLLSLVEHMGFSVDRLIVYSKVL